MGVGGPKPQTFLQLVAVQGKDKAEGLDLWV